MTEFNRRLHMGCGESLHSRLHGTGDIAKAYVANRSNDKKRIVVKTTPTRNIVKGL